MNEIELERDAVEGRYNEHFRIFVKLWKGILSEKKELSVKLKEWEKVKESLRGQSKKLSKAEQKVGSIRARLSIPGQR